MIVEISARRNHDVSNVRFQWCSWRERGRGRDGSVSRKAEASGNIMVTNPVAKVEVLAGVAASPKSATLRGMVMPPCSPQEKV
jgi:hypothetical protein